MQGMKNVKPRYYLGICLEGVRWTVEAWHSPCPSQDSNCARARTHARTHTHTESSVPPPHCYNLIRRMWNVNQYCNLTSHGGTQYLVIMRLYISSLSLTSANCIW